MTRETYEKALSCLEKMEECFARIVAQLDALEAEEAAEAANAL